MNKFKIIAFTHKTHSIEELADLQLNEVDAQIILTQLKDTADIEEAMLLTTCNRVEFLFITEAVVDQAFLKRLFSLVYGSKAEQIRTFALASATVFTGENALKHLFQVASSIDSLVVGEREIITQVRNAFELCRKWNVTGDLLRVIIRKTIETAKEVYTQTQIARNPVSVVSLAYRKLRELGVKLDARFIIIGAGVTNKSMCQYLKKHGFVNFSVFNRTLENAQKLALEVKGKAFSLADLSSYKNSFDVIVTCTGSTEHIVTTDLYKTLLNSETTKKIVVDLAVPTDLHPDVNKQFDLNLITVSNLREVASQNLKEREKELQACNLIIEQNMIEFRKQLRERRVELAMSDVPRKVKEISEIAVKEVFAKDIQQMDDQSKEVLDKVIAYLEKKYISMPMKMAKQIMIE